MARRPRHNLTGQQQRTILNGNNRRNIFTAEEDYLFFYVQVNGATLGANRDASNKGWASGNGRFFQNYYCRGKQASGSVAQEATKKGR